MRTDLGPMDVGVGKGGGRNVCSSFMDLRLRFLDLGDLGREEAEGAAPL